MIEKKFLKPAVTCTYKYCPIPYKFDTYSGCTFGCKYCFARDLIEFRRKNSEHPKFSYLYSTDVSKFKKWVEKTIDKPVNYNHAEEVAFKERIPIKIGVMSDPFPYIEKTEKATYEALKILNKYDYPVQIATKNPSILAEYYKEFRNPNWAISVTLSSFDELFRSVVEPNAPTVKDRLSAIKELTDEGAKVIVRIQPTIYPRVVEELPLMVRVIKDLGCWGFLMEGLKIKIRICSDEQKQLSALNNYLGYDIRNWYKVNGQIMASDYVLSTKHKIEYIQLAQKLANENGLKFFPADNDMCHYGTSGECCGTEILRNYKILKNIRTAKYSGSYSDEITKCKVNFVRDNKNEGMSIGEVLGI